MARYKFASAGLLALLVLSLACTPALSPGQGVAPTPDIEAIVAARVKAELTAIAPTPTTTQSSTATQLPTLAATATPRPRFCGREEAWTWHANAEPALYVVGSEASPSVHTYLMPLIQGDEFQFSASLSKLKEDRTVDREAQVLARISLVRGFPRGKVEQVWDIINRAEGFSGRVAYSDTYVLAVQVQDDRLIGRPLVSARLTPCLGRPFSPTPSPLPPPTPATREFTGPWVTIFPPGFTIEGACGYRNYRKYASFFAASGTPVNFRMQWTLREDQEVILTDPLGNMGYYKVGEVGKGGVFYFPTAVTGWYTVNVYLCRRSAFTAGTNTTFQGTLVFPGSYQAEGPIFYP